MTLKYEAKICLPSYKIIYSLFFIFLFSIIRGISDICEIGIALDPYMAIFGIVFCADTLQAEHSNKRWEIFGRCPGKIRQRTLLIRIAIQCLYLWLLSALGYICFFLQHPGNRNQLSEISLFTLFLIAALTSILFWGTLAFTFANLCQNTWAGIGIAMTLWLFANSTAGKSILGNLNVFAYVFRDVQNPADMEWLWGKGLALALAVLMALIQPQQKPTDIALSRHSSPAERHRKHHEH